MTRDAAREAEEQRMRREIVLLREELDLQARRYREQWDRETALRDAEIAALRRALDNISGIVSDGRADDVARADIAEELRCLAEESVPTPPAGGANG